MGLRQPDVAAAPQAEAPHPLRDRPLDPRPPGILGLPLGGLLPPAGRLQRLVPLPRRQRHLAPLRPGPSAKRSAGTGQALAPREPGMGHLVAPAIAPRPAPGAC